MPTKPTSKKPLYSLNKKVSGQWSSNQDKFYHSQKWRKIRELVLKTNPLCTHCYMQDKYTLATVADHIKPVRQGGEVWELSNLQGLCEACHNSKSSKESR